MNFARSGGIHNEKEETSERINANFQLWKLQSIDQRFDFLKNIMRNMGIQMFREIMKTSNLPTGCKHSAISASKRTELLY